MTSRSIILAGLAAFSLLAADCGNLHQGPSPSIARLIELDGASGATPQTFAGSLHSDVITKGSLNNDIGRVTMQLALKDPGAPGITSAPTPLNTITFTHYRVEYVRTDGRNTQGVDVPYAFDSGLTFTLPVDGTFSVTFDLVHASAKIDPPLRALGPSGLIIDTIANVTFYGTDQGGKNVQVTGSIGVTFADFADPA